MAPEVAYNEKLELVTKEIVICKLLTSNDLKVRKRGIASLKKWFREIGQKLVVDEDDYNRIWNGLFYYVWMSDKPLVQEEAAECISGMMHLIENYESAMYFIRGFFDALVKQWDRISHYRIDKFLMFVRRFLRQILVLLKNHEWNEEKLDIFSRELYTAMQILPFSLALHLNEIFNEEVAKISKGKIPTDSLVLLLKGYIECIANLRPTMQIVNSINSNVFGGLVRQLKLYIKQKALAGDGDNENVENSDYDSENESALDPRPGGVDVFLPYIEFDENIMIDFIEKYRSRPGLPLKAKNILTQMIDMFKSISRLRASVSDPIKLMKETLQENPRKRKNKSESLSKLMKKACRRLEMEDELEDEDEKILKKLQNLTDIIQIPAGRSTFTVLRAKDDKKSKKSSISNDWIVTEAPPKPESNQDVKNGNHDDCILNDNTLNVEKTQDIDKRESPKRNDRKLLKSQNTTEEQKRTSTNWIITEGPTKADSNQKIEDQNHDNCTINNKTSNDEKAVATDEYESPKSDDRKSPKSQITTEEPKRTSRNWSVSEVSSKSENNQKVENQDHDSVVISHNTSNDEKADDIDEHESEKSDDKNSSRSQDTIEESKRTSNNWSVIAVPEKIDSDHESDIPEIPVVKEKKTRKTPTKKAQLIDEKPVAVKTRATRAKRLDPVIDTSNVTEEISPIRTRSHKKKPVEPIVLLEPVEAKKSKKLPEKKVELVGRKSLRIAERQKKVQFKLEDNTFQDISTYQKFVNSKPDTPFDGSKIPSTGILKPSAVSSPINPFYYPNGERKLKRKK